MQKEGEISGGLEVLVLKTFTDQCQRKRYFIKGLILSGAATGLMLGGFLWNGTAYAQNRAYTYQVIVHGGNMGIIDASGIRVTGKTEGEGGISMESVNEGKDIKISGLEYGDTVTIRCSEAVQITNPKYYVKGVRPCSLNDDDHYSDSPSFMVTGDADYVAVYGVAGKQAGK